MSVKNKKIAILGSQTPLGTELAKELIFRGADLIIIDENKETQKLTAEIEQFRPEIYINARLKNEGLSKHKQSPFSLMNDVITNELALSEILLSAGVRRIVNILPNCIYPQESQIPLEEHTLNTGPCEETVSYYAASKKLLYQQSLAARKELEVTTLNFITTAYFGPGDNFGPDAQVVPSLIKRFVTAKHEQRDSVEIWGTGKATRDFIYIRDLVCLIIDNLDTESLEPINLSFGSEIPIRELASLIQKHTKFQGKISWDSSKPEGSLRKALSSDKMRSLLQISQKTLLETALLETIEWYENEFRNKNP